MTQWGLDTLFNPAKRHMDEEKRRLQSTREEIGDSSGGKRIDLESGKVTIRRTARAGDDDEAQDEQAQDDEALGEEAQDEEAQDAGQAKAADETQDADGGEAAEDVIAQAVEEPEQTSEERRAKPEPSPAAIRAAKRRGLKPR